MERKTEIRTFTIERGHEDGKTFSRINTYPTFGKQPVRAGVITKTGPETWAVGGVKFKDYVTALGFVIKRFLPYAKISRIGIDNQGKVTARVEIEK